MNSYSKKILLLVACVAPLALVAAAGEVELLPRIGMLVVQLALILLATRIGRALNKTIGIPLIMNDLLVGVLIGPYLLGGIHISGVFDGIFPRIDGALLSVSNELYLCAMLGSAILFFAMGLETDLSLFFRYSIAGVIIGLGGALLSFAAGVFATALFLKAPITASPCLFMGLLAAITSTGISSRTLQRQKSMDSPEGVSGLAAAGADNILGMLLLVVVSAIAAVPPVGVNGLAIVAGKAAIWLVVLAVVLVSSKSIADFLNMSRLPFDLSLLALGIALLVAAFFEKLGLPLIAGAYIVGLSLSKTPLAPLIQERIHGIYEFFVPICFAVMGMLIRPAALLSTPAILFMLGATALFMLAKLAGCGIPALIVGFNTKGALRIGALMISRGELSIIIACTALVAGAFDERLFAAAIVMCLITSCLSPTFLRLSLSYTGSGTRKHVKSEDISNAKWEFYTPEIAGLVADTLLGNLKADGFFVQQINLDEDISQARKDSIAFSISKHESALSIDTNKADMGFVRAEVHKVVLALRAAVQKIALSSDPKSASSEQKGSAEQLLAIIKWEHIELNLKSDTKEAVLAELVDILASRGKLRDRDEVVNAVLAREKIMSTGMQRGIALPHARSDGINDLHVAIGVKKSGVDFDSIDGEKARLFVLVVSPKARDSQHMAFLAAISATLRDPATCEQVINAATNEEALALLQGKAGR
ncbi:MAG: cation:proton antiporter [Treponema sp.]|jgi:Kef-type K+ transport system membrane component KefB/mannitol/fructose-specific phosphotransferase system IIA component (Ntr-type)|nr:cation:proton antiporter [Treponema sp.]